MKKIDGLSKDIERTEREKLASVFPQCFVEGKLDIDKLLSLCGEYILKDFEKYEFTWKGKSECLPLAQQRSTATLRPCPEESVNFDTTQNLYIEGDNLEVLKLLQTSYFRKIKMIYIDPPYNTGHDFVYEDDFSDTLARYKEVTSQTTKSNPESMGRFHTNWLNMMYPRLRLAANLLRDDGVIFISIDDNEVHNLRKLCDEVFGEENRLGIFVWKRRQNADSRNKTNISPDHEYIVAYGRDINTIRVAGADIDITKYKNPDNDPRGPWASIDLSGLATKDQRPNLHYDIVDPNTGVSYPPNSNRGWSKSKTVIQSMIEEGRILFPSTSTGRPREKKFLNELRSTTTGTSTWLDSGVVGFTTHGTREVSELFGDKVFDFPKPVILIKWFIEQCVLQKDDIILDFFSGTATTAHAVMQLNAEDGGNRHFILVQLPERCSESSEAFKAGYKNICEIGKERIRRAGAKIIENGQSAIDDQKQKKNGAQLSLLDVNSPFSILNSQLPDTGFKVFKLDSSNLKIWDSSRFPEDDLLSISNRLNNMIDRVKSDRTDLDVVYEIMLKLGVPLTYSVTPLNIGPAGPQGRKTAYSVGDECLLIICLAENLTTEMIEKMAEYTPGQIVLAEHSLADLSAMRNAHYILKDRNIELKLV